MQAITIMVKNTMHNEPSMAPRHMTMIRKPAAKITTK